MTLTTDQQIITLKIRGDPDGTGSRTATFELESAPDSGLSVSHTIRTGFLVDDQGQLVNSILSEVLGDGESRNKGIYVDAGTSSYALDCEFRGYDGGAYQWGDTGNGGTATDATGDSAVEQVQVFFNWINAVSIDSLPDGSGDTSATLEFGLYHPDGPLDPLDVVIENPTLTPAEPTTFDGNLVFIEAENLGKALDAAGNSKAGSGSS